MLPDPVAGNASLRAHGTGCVGPAAKDILSYLRRKEAGDRGTTTEEAIMVSIVMLGVIGLCAGWIVWRRQRRRHAYAAPVTPEGIPRETLALHAFTRGNTCLAEGKLTEAIAAFHEARELNPKRAHIDARLAEAERQQQVRQQQVASAPPPVPSTE